MKSLLILVLSFAFLQIMLAQPNTQKDADETAADDELPILLVFSGSDWCKPCIKLKKEVIDTPEFQALAKDQMKIQVVDFPYKKANKLSKEKQAENNALAEQYNPEGLLPNMLLVDKSGELLRVVRSRSKPAVIRELQSVLSL